MHMNKWRLRDINKAFRRSDQSNQWYTREYWINKGSISDMAIKAAMRRKPKALYHGDIPMTETDYRALCAQEAIKIHEKIHPPVLTPPIRVPLQEVI